MPAAPSSFAPAICALALAIALALSACNQSQAPASPTAPTAPTAGPAGRTALADHSRLGLEELRIRGRLALREQRIYAPAGDNAIEYYIAARDGSASGDQLAANAVMELQPYAVIAAEQALERGDFVEAERLRRLVAATDPRAPSLSRIASAIVSGLARRSNEARERVASNDEEGAVEPEPANAPTGVAALAATLPVATVPGRPATTAPVAVSPSVAAVAAAPPVAAIPTTAPRAPPTVATPRPDVATTAAPARAELVALRTPQPQYPEERRRLGEIGQVRAFFTVNSDGTVGEIRTESIGSRRLAFERSVVLALRRWKYQPLGETRDVTLNFSFAP